MAKTKKNVQKKRRQLRKKTRGGVVLSNASLVGQKYAKIYGTDVPGGVEYNVYYHYYNKVFGPYMTKFLFSPAHLGKENVAYNLYYHFWDNREYHGLNANLFKFDRYDVTPNRIDVTLYK